MSEEVIAVTQGAELSARVARQSDLLTLQLTGTADLRVTETIGTLLASLHDSALEGGTPKVLVDMRELEFMNSSCFKNFVKWISDVQNLPLAKQYRIRFLSNPAILWQRRSLHALSCFAADLITIDSSRR